MGSAPSALCNNGNEPGMFNCVDVTMTKISNNCYRMDASDGSNDVMMRSGDIDCNAVCDVYGSKEKDLIFYTPNYAVVPNEVMNQLQTFYCACAANGDGEGGGIRSFGEEGDVSADVVNAAANKVCTNKEFNLVDFGDKIFNQLP